jgi:hypothetical protein
MLAGFVDGHGHHRDGALPFNDLAHRVLDLEVFEDDVVLEVHGLFMQSFRRIFRVLDLQIDVTIFLVKSDLITETVDVLKIDVKNIGLSHGVHRSPYPSGNHFPNGITEHFQFIRSHVIVKIVARNICLAISIRFRIGIGLTEIVP